MKALLKEKIYFFLLLYSSRKNKGVLKQHSDLSQMFLSTEVLCEEITEVFLFLLHVLKWRMTLINCIWITNHLWQISEVVGKRRKMPSKCFLNDLKMKIFICLLLLKVLSIHMFCLKPFIKWPLIMHYSIFMDQHSNCPTGTLHYVFKVMKLIINFIICLISLLQRKAKANQEK